MSDENLSEAILFVSIGVALGIAVEIILRLTGCAPVIL